MGICKKCNSTFPNNVLIDGKWRTTRSRKYCLECSPYGAHNTREPFDGILRCTVCNLVKPYVYGEGGTRSLCKSCKQQRRRATLRIKLVALLGNKCKFCGYSRCNAALAFHHREPNTKKFAISGNETRNWAEVYAEAMKCDLLCMNCHTELHNGYVA